MQVAASSHPDLHLLGLPTGKKEIPVDLVRQLKRFAGMQSVAAPRKMAIVDDADRLSIASQNALLKTLEEPPGPALVVLVTASPGQLLSTVRSRCQRVLFQPLAPEDVRAVLEQNGIDPEEAGALAAQADGSPGLALRGRGVWQDSERAALVGLLADLDPGRYGSVVAMSKALGKSEHEMVVRLEGLLGWYRDQAVRAVAGPSAAALDARAAVRGADIVAEALRTLRRRNPNRPLLAEALALRLARC